MIPIRMTVMTSFMYSCFDYRMIYNSDSIRLGLCGMRQRYIYEGFLVWIIPSMY